MRRNLTVSSLRREWGPIYRMRTDYVPAIRLNGQWLEKSGFKTGDKVTVYAEAGSLAVIKEVAPPVRLAP